MKTSLKWLNDYIDINLPAGEIAQKLTMAGLEVKNTRIIGGNWDKIVIGQIKAINPHPNADRLRLTTVDLGYAAETVVCGAPNLKLGDKVAFAKVGAELIDGHTGVKSVLKEAKIRGVPSAGMVCSEKELGISDNHTGVLVLPPGTPLGVPLASYLSDALFNIEVTPNRPDCLSVIGIARELGVLTGQRVRLPDDKYPEVEPPIEEQVVLEIRAPDLCPRYSATIIKGVKIADSPDWMKERLIAGGMRPINNIVDITNFVMLEYGQPLHSFDYDRINGNKIIVRRARAGEKMQTLDGTERELTAHMLVIADAERTVAVAGVMGGANTEVTGQTTSILLEAANFNPSSIHYTGRSLGVASEAATRFERGIQPALTIPALRRATKLIQELGGGTVTRGIIDVYPGKQAVQSLVLSTRQVKRILGVEVSLPRIIEILVALGFACEHIKPDEIAVTPPYWRSDIRLIEDLVEEVARINGYDKIPMTLLAQSIPRQDPLSALKLKREVRNILVGYGFDEVMTPSLIGMELLKKITPEGIHVEALRLTNPMSSDLEYLRPTLRANLLSILVLNQRSIEGMIRIAEISKVFIPRENDLPDERDMACGIISGSSITRWWHGEEEAPDYYTVKGVVEGVFKRLNITPDFIDGDDPGLHAIIQAKVMVGDKQVGVIGEVHPRVREKFEITGIAYYFELDLASLADIAVATKSYKPLPRFPAVVRDLAVVVEEKIRNKQVMRIISGFPLVEDVSLFDVYAGEQVPPGQKSLAYRITFQSPNKTLTDEAVNAVMKQIIAKLNKDLSATIRQ